MVTVGWLVTFLFFGYIHIYARLIIYKSNPKNPKLPEKVSESLIIISSPNCFRRRSFPRVNYYIDLFIHLGGGGGGVGLVGLVG